MPARKPATESVALVKSSGQGPLACGTCLIKTTHHAAGQQPAGWGLACFPNNWSSWVHVHAGDEWPCRWEVRPGQQPGTYRLYTCGHEAGGQRAGWGLSAWHAHGAWRNEASSWVAVHEGEHWPMDWRIVAGRQPNTWRVLTTAHVAGHQEAGWGLSAWNAHSAKRNDHSSRVAVHNGDHWPMEWVFERVGGEMPGDPHHAPLSHGIPAEDDCCFNADATIELRSGKMIRMDELAVGDVVRSDAAGGFSTVYTFAHHKGDTARAVGYRRILLESGPRAHGRAHGVCRQAGAHGRQRAPRRRAQRYQLR